MRLGVGLALAVLPVWAEAACPLPATAGAVLTSGPVQLAWQAEPKAIKAGQPFGLLVTLCPASARLTAVDATMPEHRHGMNYKPSLQAVGDGVWRVNGLLWHMSGRWELRLDVAAADGTAHTLRQAVTLP